MNVTYTAYSVLVKFQEYKAIVNGEINNVISYCNKLLYNSTELYEKEYLIYVGSFQFLMIKPFDDRHI